MRKITRDVLAAAEAALKTNPELLPADQRWELAQTAPGFALRYAAQCLSDTQIAELAATDAGGLPALEVCPERLPEKLLYDLAVRFPWAIMGTRHALLPDYLFIALAHIMPETALQCDPVRLHYARDGIARRAPRSALRAASLLANGTLFWCVKKAPAEARRLLKTDLDSALRERVEDALKRANR